MEYRHRTNHKQQHKHKPITVADLRVQNGYSLQTNHKGITIQPQTQIAIHNLNTYITKKLFFLAKNTLVQKRNPTKQELKHFAIFPLMQQKLCSYGVLTPACLN